MKSKTTGYYFALALAAAGTLLLVGSRSAAVEAVYPAEHAKETFVRKVWSRVRGCFEGSAACAENVRLKREVASLSLLRGDVERLERENARLRRALDYASRVPESWLAASVLSRGGGAAGVHNAIRVDKGSLAGVKKGEVVSVPEGLVGLVTAVTPHTSEVTLVTDPSVKVACVAECGAGRRAYGIVSGCGDEVLALRHIRGAAEIPPRSKVLTSGRGGVFPPGLEVGALLDVRKDARGLACEGEVLPQVDFSTLEDVFIRHER